MRDDDAFAGGEAVGLEDYGKAETFDCAASVGGVFDSGVVGGRDSGLHEKVLCKNFAAFQLRRARDSVRRSSGRARGTRRPRRRQAALRVRRLSSRRRSVRPLPEMRRRTAGKWRFAMPGFPGVAKTSTPCDCASFQQSACSLPPPPRTRILTISFRYNHNNAREVRRGGVGAGHAGCEAARACARMGCGPPWSR
jgi:hypothetical protein